MTDAAWPYPGARWWKFDFHTHTPASYRDWDPDAPTVTPKEWLLAYMAAGIDCVAITDHNSGEWIDPLKAAYEALRVESPAGFRELHLFPGVELSVSGGVHLLAVFDTTARTSDIDSLLGKVDYEGTKGDSDGVTRLSIADVIRRVRNAGGVAIPAHSDARKGLLQLDAGGGLGTRVDPGTLRQVLDDGLVAAIETLDPRTAKPSLYTQSKIRWTEVLGSDSHSLSGDKKPGSFFTWVKMARPSLEGLRLALLDGGNFSVRRSDSPGEFSPSALPTHFLESVSISDARYMGRGEPAKLLLSPWFNAIVGGRGTGKSTVVHALRLAYRREGELIQLPKENEVRLAFERFIRAPKSRNDESGALDYETSKRTSIAVEILRDGRRERLRWRQDGTGAVVEDYSGTAWTPASAQSVGADRFPIRIFSQGQIAALAGENQRSLLELIDEAADVRPIRQTLRDREQRFLTLRAQIRELESKLSGRDDLQGKLDDVQRKLGTFEGQEHAEILKAYQLRARQNREIDRQLEAAAKLAARFAEEATGIAGEQVSPGLFDETDVLDNQALTLVRRLHDAIGKAADSLRRTAEELAAAALREREAMAETDWFVKSVESRTQYEELRQAIAEQGVSDPSQYGSLVQERQRLEQEIQRLEALERERTRIEELCGDALKACRAARTQITDRRIEFLNESLAGNQYVQIELQPYGRSAKAIETELREALGVPDGRFEDDILLLEDDEPKSGVVARLLRGLTSNAADLNTAAAMTFVVLSEQFTSAASGRGAFGGHFNNYIQRESAKRPEFLDRLLLWTSDDSLRVEYSPKGDGRDFKPIQQASAGQRAAAMLAFLLVHGSEPLVLDQPEDDLDNHLIYELVVQQIRDIKQRRQLIVVTHNPNIVVNGDAEMVHCMDFLAGQCRVVQAGSLQEKAIREEVCRVMEGGREAFESRYHRIGGKRTDV